MNNMIFKNKAYQVDSGGFLLDSSQWDENFAETMAAEVKMTGGLSKEHWNVINYIRNTYKEMGICPSIYQSCRANKLHLKQLRDLFPMGYLRGACKLSGITYKEGYLKYSWLQANIKDVISSLPEKNYMIDVRGFLVDPSNWDMRFAIFKAHELKMPEGLTDKHWQIIEYMRTNFIINNIVPTSYETCDGNDIECEELEQLFPDGYHRGAVKVAGLRVR